MSRSFTIRPFATKYGGRPRRLAATTLSATLAICALSVCALSSGVRADEFSPVPAGDPIYRQLSALDSADPTTASAGAGLTRYEAALQVARIITRVSNDSSAKLSRVGWRALRDLSGSLKSELTQLGIDVAAAQKLADDKIKAPEARPDARKTTRDELPADLSAPAGLNSGRALPLSIVRGAAGDTLLGANGFNGAVSGGSVLGGASYLQPGSAFAAGGLQNSQFSASIVPRLRVGAALLALQRAESDPFKSSSAGQALLSSGNTSRVLGSDASVDYDVTSWLSVRAQSSRRSLANVPEISPFLRSALFEGASEARSAGGGLGIDMGALSFSTKFESLSTDTGSRATSVDGGVRLSAWQNRLSLSAHMARLQPEDRAFVPLTKTELNIGLNVSQRLSLNLFYQGLFTQQNANNSERVAGGLNLSF